MLFVLRRSDKIVRGQGYAQLRCQVSDSLSIVSTDRKDGRADHKMVIRVMREVVKRMVVLQEPLKGIGRAMEEERGRVPNQRGGKGRVDW